YEWDEEDVSSDDNEMTEVKVLMALVDDEDVVVGQENAKNKEWVKISIRKVHTLIDLEDNDERKYFVDYLCIDLSYVEEQINNIVLKHRNLVQELNTCKERLLVLKQEKLDFLTMQHVNTKILKENKNLRIELKELSAITETWLNSSNKVNRCIDKQIPSQMKGILGLDQLTEDPSNSWQTDLVFVKSSAEYIKVSIPSESQVNTTDPPVAVTDSSTAEYDSTDESLVYNTPFPLQEKLAGEEPVSGPKTMKSILKSNSTFKTKALKGVTINEPSSAPAKVNASSSKTNSAPSGKLKNVKNEDDFPLASVMKELHDLKLQISKNQSSHSKNSKSQHVPQNALQNRYKTQFKTGCELCRLNNHLSEHCYKVLFCKKYERTDHITCNNAEYMSTMNMSQHLKSQGGSSSKSTTPRPLKNFFPPCIHRMFNDHLSDDCVNYPICDIYGSYDHDTYGHNKVISLRRGIKPRNTQ
ncbi:hypothetical protein Tco_1496937, partial [Tanacetum coccineum]